MRDGITLIEEIHKIGQFQIFLDLKLYDIPNTMLDTFSEIAKLHIDMLTIHASSGSEAMKLLSKYAKSIPNAKIYILSAKKQALNQTSELPYISSS